MLWNNEKQCSLRALDSATYKEERDYNFKEWSEEVSLERQHLSKETSVLSWPTDMPDISGEEQGG